MFEKVNPAHPDKVADRIAGAIVDLVYKVHGGKEGNPRTAVEILIGHGHCHIINETTEKLNPVEVDKIVDRIAGRDIETDYLEVPQDPNLSANQAEEIRCGDNGIFKGMPVTKEQSELSKIARYIYGIAKCDGKYILDEDKLIICQSNMSKGMIATAFAGARKNVIINPIGDWTGGTSVDGGVTNRKLGSDMADSVTGGGINGKDISKADVSANVVAFLLAQEYQTEVNASCAIGDKEITFHIKDIKDITMPYIEICKKAKEYIDSIGGFEKFSEWGLV